RIFVAGSIPKAVYDKLSRVAEVRQDEARVPLSADSLSKQTSDSDALLCIVLPQIDEAFLKKHAKLKLVANSAVGYDNIDLAAARKRGVRVVNTPGVVNDATADLTMALILNLARRITEAERFLRAGKWKEREPLMGTDLRNKTLGIIGMGRIGKA